jgi:four helix bundle protein
MSFDFQNLEVYKKAKTFHINCKHLIETNKLPSYTNNQFGRASLSIALNIAEGAGKFSKPDRRNFYITARASVYECVAIIDILHDEHIISNEIFNDLLRMADELSRILYAMIKNLTST